MKNNNNYFLGNKLLDISFDESDLETYFMINNIEVRENNII